MSHEHFGAGMHHQIRPQCQRPVIERAGPAVIHDQSRAIGMSGCGNGGNVLHFKRQRAGAFCQNGRGVGLHQRADSRANARIEIACRHAHALQKAVGKAAAGGSKLEDLQKIKQLLDTGVLTKEEFEKLKKRIINN